MERLPGIVSGAAVKALLSKAPAGERLPAISRVFLEILMALKRLPKNQAVSAALMVTPRPSRLGASQFPGIFQPF